jgi:hypothetical protein
MIFINYRRDDSTGMSGRLHDRLANAFGQKNLFMDVDHIPPGVDFVKHLNDQVAVCDVFLAVIGPNWLKAKNEEGDPRLYDPDDFVTIEIAAALARDIRVIPVLVDDARMPKAGDLPETLKPLVRRHAVNVRHDHFGRDAQALIDRIREALPAKPARVTAKWQIVGGLAAVTFLGFIGLFLADVPSLQWTVPLRVQTEAGMKVAPGQSQQQAAPVIEKPAATQQTQEAPAASKQTMPPQNASPIVEPLTQKVFGLKLATLNADLRGQYMIAKSVEGVLITEVDYDSDAATKRLSPGDVITEVAMNPVRSIADVKNLINERRGKFDSVMLTVSSNGVEERVVALRLGR